MNAPEHQSKEILRLLDAHGLPKLGETFRTSSLPLAQLNDSLDHTFSTGEFPAQARSLIRSLVLLWHDHLDASHDISQNLPDATGSFIHGVMHRREPDYDNAKYWFRRVGQHSCFPQIARRVSDLGEDFPFIAKKHWDAFGFVDACESALRENDSKMISRLEKVQAIELRTLLEFLLAQPSA